MVTRQKREVYYNTNVEGIKIRHSGVPNKSGSTRNAYQEEIGSTGPAPET